MKYALLAATVLLAGCAQQVPVAPVVVTPVEEVKPEVPEVTPPPRSTIPKFTFQDPRLPTAIVAMDAENYAAFREVLLLANKRELDWNSRLQRANKSIRLLKGDVDHVDNVPSTKPVMLPIPKARPEDARSNSTR